MSRRHCHTAPGGKAQIRFDNPLGDEYVYLQAPSTLADAPGPTGTRYLGSGAVIPEASTSTAPSVEDTFGALSLVLNGGGINQLETIIHELNDTFTGNQPPIRSFLTTIAQGEAGTPIRVVSVLAPGQRVVLSTPHQADALEISRNSDSVLVRKVNAVSN